MGSGFAQRNKTEQNGFAITRIAGKKRLTINPLKDLDFVGEGHAEPPEGLGDEPVKLGGVGGSNVDVLSLESVLDLLGKALLLSFPGACRQRDLRQLVSVSEPPSVHQ